VILQDCHLYFSGREYTRYEEYDEKPVHMLSTFHSAQELPSGRPKIVNNYNINMGGVDTTDATMKACTTLNLRKLLLQCIFLNFLK
jgi:hypothetical protein